MDDELVRKTAQRFVRNNKDLIIDKFASESIYSPDDFPVTVFMAGSPGAGKTEISIGLVSQFTSPAVRIDADDIRTLCDGYAGSNAHLFQSAASIGVDILYNHCLTRKLNMVVDGTFAHQKTISNIEKALDTDRKVIIYFVYQDPQVAWDFTKKREEVVQRKITKESFIKGYCMSRINVNDAKERFKDRVELNLLIKNLTNDNVSAVFKDIPTVDLYLKTVYTEAELVDIIV